jgi:L-lactate dehydrogenase complex protein LldG
MSNAARNRIFDRLRSALEGGAMPVPPEIPLPPPVMNDEEKVSRFSQMMEAVRTEVHAVSAENWTDRLKEILRAKGAKTLAYGPQGSLAETIEAAWQQKSPEELPQLVAYDSVIEDFKETLFRMDAGITTTLGGIADVGAIIMWPTEAEPRLLSLVPPIHIAVVHAEALYTNFSEVLTKQGWRDGMPTNALLASGPSKTADIEFQLVFGVHGPKELIVLLLKDG